MSETGVKCPQSHVGEIPQNQQLYLILPNILPQRKILSQIPILNLGF